MDVELFCSRQSFIVVFGEGGREAKVFRGSLNFNSAVFAGLNGELKENLPFGGNNRDIYSVDGKKQMLN